MFKKNIDQDDGLDDDDNIYNFEMREIMLENDELSPREEAFLRGWDESYEL